MTARRAESDIALLARLAREVEDLRGTALARMATRARLEVPVFQGQQATNQSLTSGSLTAISLDQTAIIDTHGGHSATSTPSRWTCPTGWAGTYLASGRVRVATSVSGQIITCGVAVNGTNLEYAQVDSYGSSPDFSSATGAVYVALAEGDYVQLVGAQYSGSTRSTVAANCALAIGFVRR